MAVFSAHPMPAIQTITLHRALTALILIALAPATLAGIIGRDVSLALEQQSTVRLLVAFRDGLLPAARAAAFARAAGELRVVQRFERLGIMVVDADLDAVDALERDPDVWKADLDVGGTGGDAASLSLIGGDTAHAMGFTGSGVTVAVLDSGIDRNHPDLKDALVDEACFCANGAAGCCPNGQQRQTGAGAAMDDHGHGTNVSGILAGRGGVAPIGVAPAAKIVAVKVLDSANRFSGSSQVIEGMDWLAQNHPEVRVVNMSLYTSMLFTSYCDTTTSFTIAFARAVAALRSNGSLVFACAGNDASAISVGAPACVQQALSVGAVYTGTAPIGSCGDTTATPDQIACFSDSNATLDLLGPGTAVTSTGLMSRGGLSTFTGTSQATPHSAGTAALLFAFNPLFSADTVETILKQSGKPIVDKRNGVSAPRVDAAGAVRWVTTPHVKKRAVRP